MSVHPQEVEPSAEPLIVGLTAIGAIFHRHRETISRWTREEEFPAAQMPNGTYITSLTLVDEWLRSRCHASKKHTDSATVDSRV